MALVKMRSGRKFVLLTVSAILFTIATVTIYPTYYAEYYRKRQKETRGNLTPEEIAASSIQRPWRDPFAKWKRSLHDIAYKKSEE
uniref:Uncharacterized protein n=1 Tax=Acrobeloides nanus TaxID=290746 RepID=A0A914E5J2_9BILA